MDNNFKSIILYYAGWNSFTHVGGAFYLAKMMPDVLFHVASAEKWPFPPQKNIIFHKLYKPNCAMRIDDRFFLKTYPYENNLGDINKYRKHIFGFVELLKKINPNLVISDITLEVALLSKYFGYPTCVFYETVETNNLRHKLAWDNVDSILVRYNKRFLEYVEPNIHSKMFFAGGVSKFDLIEKKSTNEQSKKLIGLQKNRKAVTFLASSHSHNNGQVKRYFQCICEGLNMLPSEYQCFVLYPQKDQLVNSLRKKCKNLNFIVGVFNQVHHYLAVSDIVLTAAGLGAIMESAYFRTPMLLIPVPWTINEQMIKATALEKMGAARLINPASMTPEIIKEQTLMVLEDKVLQESMKEKERELIDKKGYQRLSRHIYKMLGSNSCENKVSVLNDL